MQRSDITYKDPVVKLIDTTKSDLGFLMWLKSRQWVISDTRGNRFMVAFNILSKDITYVPKNFYVGDELVDRDKYYERILSMNLQYMNFYQYVFEIQGSCLFRDLLFNVNKVSQWAQSNRFLFSILDKDQVYNSANYFVSSEYKDIPEWEEQFEIYMDKIKNDPIVDHNRVEMPYSISSTFWISINHKTLLDLLSFLKNQAPFFYKVYGKQFLSKIGAPEDEIPANPSAAITQYIMKNWDNWSPSIDLKQGTYNINIDLGLILYSQFIRQADTKISGYYNELIHDDPEEFKHKVFKGGTVIKVNYVADEDKVKSTVKTRLCAFAMSSGSEDDPCSWNHFISKFIPKDISNYYFSELLPCTFEDGKLVKCKFYDDVKFRNEGKEISNCPCPLVTLSVKHAQEKKDRDNNVIGDAYYNLTQYLINGGFDHKLQMTRWTSDLVIYFDTCTRTSDYLAIEIDNILRQLASDRDKAMNGLKSTYIDSKYLKYGYIDDITCMMKGAAIDRISALLNLYNCNRYIINFGGDIYTHNAKTQIQIEDTKFFIDIDGNDYSIFTSGNTKKRGNHIVGGTEGYFNTLVFKHKPSEYVSNINLICDILSTKLFAKEEIPQEFADIINNVELFTFSEEGKLQNQTYCASPFFNEKQIEIRDKMISQFDKVFRPDKTESSDLFESGNGNPEDVVDDNIKGISDSEFLVYPESTDDLGTLFEVGYSLSQHNFIIKYIELEDKYLILNIDDNSEIIGPDLISTSNQLLFNCNNKDEVIALGYVSAYLDSDSLYYELNGAKDNLMLSTYYHHIEKIGDEYHEFTRDKNSKDTES